MASLANCYPDVKDEAEVHHEAIELLRAGCNEDDLLERLGAETPQAVKEFLLKVDRISKNLLPDAERLLLPSPGEMVRNKQAGRIIFGGIKRRLYVRICDKESEVYKEWVHKGLDRVLAEGYVSNAVLATFIDLKVGLGALAISVSALVMRLGIRNFCDRNRPTLLMDLRTRKGRPRAM